MVCGLSSLPNHSEYQQNNQRHHVLCTRIGTSLHFLMPLFVKVIIFNLRLFENQTVLQHLSFDMLCVSYESKDINLALLAVPQGC